MKLITIYLSLLCWIFLGISCSTSDKQPDQVYLSSENQKAFDLHLAQLENKQFRKAAFGFQALSNKVKESPRKWAILFNTGSAFLQIRHCTKAKGYLKTIISGDHIPDSFKAPALLQTAYAHECLGEIKKAIEVLQKIGASAKYMSENTRAVEIPGRLFMFHRYLGNDKQSLFQEERALAGIRLIKSSIKVENLISKEASQLFYIIGRSLIHTKHVKIKEFLRAILYHQLYLSQSIVVSSSKWSTLSVKELSSIYEKLWASYKVLPTRKKLKYKKSIRFALAKLHQISVSNKNKSLKRISEAIIKKTNELIK